MTPTHCPECGHDGVESHERDVRVEQDGVTLTTIQDGYECDLCGERFSTADQCAEADRRLMALGWRPRVQR